MCDSDYFEVVEATPVTVNKWKMLYFFLKTSSLLWSKNGLQMLVYHSAVFIYVYMPAIVPAAHSEDRKSW